MIAASEEEALGAAYKASFKEYPRPEWTNQTAEVELVSDLKYDGQTFRVNLGAV